MNRREFLKKIGIGAAAVSMPVAAIASSKKKVTISDKLVRVRFPRRMASTEVVKRQKEAEERIGDRLTTIDEITRDALKLLNKNLVRSNG